MASPPKHQPAKVVTVKNGHLPVTEFLSDRAGANSPFGDDQTFPLPVSALVYRHPTREGLTWGWSSDSTST